MMLTATDVRLILAGRGRAVHDRLTGAAGPADLSGVLSVHIGAQTERLNLDWLHRRVEDSSLFRLPTAGMVAAAGARQEEIAGQRIVERGGYRAKADGFLVVPDLGTVVVEAKHVSEGRFAGQIQAEYLPQLFVTMHVCGLRLGVLSVFYGLARHTAYFVAWDEAYWAAIEREVRAFLAHLELGIPPDGEEEPANGRITLPAIHTNLKGLRKCLASA
jgi:hypothetical protein